MSVLQTKIQQQVLIFSLCITFCSQVLTAPDLENKVTAEQLNLIAYEKLKQGAYREAYELSRHAKLQAGLEHNDKELARALSNLASNLLYLGENEAALNLYNQSLDIANTINDVDGINRAINNIASIFVQLGNFDEALKYRNQQLEHSQDFGSHYHQTRALISLAQVHLNVNNAIRAKHFLDLAKEHLLQQPNPFLHVYLFFAESAIHGFEDNNVLATKSLRKALKIATENNFNGLIASITINIAEIYFKNNELSMAESDSLASLKSAQKLQLKSKELQSHKLLSNIYRAKGDYKKALEHSDSADNIQQKISGEKVRQLAEITRIDRNMAETEEKLRQSLQQKEIAELKVESQQQQQFVLAAIFVFLLMLLFFWFYRKASRGELNRQKQLNQELKELDKLKDRILTNTSHELRTPLNGIVGLSDIILNEYEGKIDENLKNSIALIGKSGIQLSEIINDILDLAQLKARRMLFKSSKFNLATLVHDVVILCKPMLRSDEVEIVFDGQPHELNVIQDKQRVQQVLFNLIGNAVKFTDKGQVSINYHVESNIVWVHINDTGIGIPENKVDRVFEGFEQVNPNDNRQYSGSGLGLAICRELAFALDGKISLQSEFGHGTLVSFSFPLVHKPTDS